MADMTPRYTRLCTVFMQRIQDPVALGGAGVDVLQGGNIVTTKAAIEAYINKAMFKLIETYWTGLKGDKYKVSQVFPELIEGRTISFDASQQFALTGSTNRDIWEVLEAVQSSTFIEAPKTTFYLSAQYGAVQYRATSQFPKIFKINNKLEILGLDFSVATNVSVLVLRQPLNPTNGNLLQQSNSSADNESPFSDLWTDKIAEIAEQLWRIDGNEAR